MRTQVAIIGGGPSGLLLSQLLMNAGIETVVLERRSRDYVLSRIRAGVIEWQLVELLRSAGVGARLDAEGHPHEGVHLASQHGQFRVDFVEGCGRKVMVYGQTEITKDLYEAQDRIGAKIVEDAENVAIHGADTDRPFVTWTKDGAEHRLDCDFVAGCDGFHGVSRQTIPSTIRKEIERVYPFGWLGILSRTPPAAEELIYANSPRGFALASMRNPMLSRHYIQVPLTDTAEMWSDDAFWDEYRRRLPAETAESLVTGPSIEKSVAPLRSFVSEPMRWGRLFLAGDAAHIVPPTGAKGLNLAGSDIFYLSQAMKRHYHDKDDGGIEAYSERALARVWQATRFSWWMTRLLHRFPDQEEFDQHMQESEILYVERSERARAQLSEQYCGLPY